MARTRIKICGIRDDGGVRASVEAGADAIGFVFVPESPRFIEPADAWALVSALPAFVTSVGLFKDASIESFCDVEEQCPTALSQFHGNEDDETVRSCGPGVIKAVRFSPETIEPEVRRWDAIDEVDAILVDGSEGGKGTALDWGALRRALDAARPAKPVILAGGLTPTNVGEAIRVVRPYAVDVSSGVESSPGVKDPALIEAFCAAVRRADLG